MPKKKGIPAFEIGEKFVAYLALSAKATQSLFIYIEVFLFSVFPSNDLDLLQDMLCAFLVICVELCYKAGMIKLNT